MRIVYLLLHDFRFASIGLEEFALHRFHFSKEYASRMAKLGHDVKLYVLSDDARGNRVIQLDGYELRSFRTSFRFPPFARFGNDHAFSVLREIRRDSPDLVHIHNYYLWNFPYIAPWARHQGTPVVAQFHGTDPIRGIKGRAFYPSLRLCDRLLVPTMGEERFLARSLRISGSRVEHFPSTGVDTKLFRPTGSPRSELTLLYVGRIPIATSYRWEKAPQYLLPIIRALLDLGIKAKLMIAGDGPGLPPMQTTAQLLHLGDSVEFLGQLDQSRLPELYSRSNLTFIPILMDDIEPFWGGSVQESLACGTPVVAFNNNSPGFRKFGLLVTTHAREAARLLSEALSDPRLLAIAREEGPKFIEDNCSWDVMATRLNTTYRRLKG